MLPVLSTLPTALLQSCDIDRCLHTSEHSEGQVPAVPAAWSPWLQEEGSAPAAELFDFVVFEQHQHAPLPSLGFSCAFCLSTTSFPFLAERTKAFRKHPPVALPGGLVLSPVPQFGLLCLSCRALLLNRTPADMEPALNRGSACCKGRGERHQRNSRVTLLTWVTESPLVPTVHLK